MRAGDQAVPGDGVHAPSGAGQDERDVDHGEAGAEEQQVLVLGQAAQCPRGPRVGDEPRRAAEPGGRPGVVGREGAEGEHHGVGVQAASGAEPERHPGSGPPGGDDPVVHPVQPGGAGPGLGGRQYLAEVGPVEAAGDVVGGGVDAGRAAGQPAHEVVRRVGEGAHPTGRDVEQVVVGGRGIGRAPAGGGGAVDQPDVERDAGQGGAAQQLRGGEHAGRARAHDGDAAGVLGHGVAPASHGSGAGALHVSGSNCPAV